MTLRDINLLAAFAGLCGYLEALEAGKPVPKEYLDGLKQYTTRLGIYIKETTK
jgi:hypothetical protein